jgi:hypothetical protein
LPPFEGFLDDRGQQVSTFARRALNLTRTAELVDVIAEMATTDAWRDYRDALGEHRWLESEFDYFLIECGLRFDDVSRVIAWSRKGGQLAPLMDTAANADRRRPLEEASAAWQSPGGGSLADRAHELGWTRTDRASRSMLPLVKTAVPKGTLTRARRAARPTKPISAKRRRELDALAAQVNEQLADAQERIYVIRRLRR